MSSYDDFPIAVVSIVWLGWLSILLPRMIVTPLIPLIEQTYSLPHAQAGLLMTVYLLPYAVTQMLAGTLCDRFGTRKFITASLTGSSLASLAIWLTTSFEQILALRVVAGVLAGMWFAPSTTLVTLSAKDKDRGKAMGIVFMGGSIANVIIFLLVGLLTAASTDWRVFFVLASVPGLVAACLVLALVPEPSSVPRRSTSGFDSKAVLAGLKQRPVVILLALNTFLMTANWALRTFVPTYLVQVRSLSTSEASLLMLLYALANVSADPVAGFLADKLGSRLPGLASLSIMCLVSLTMPLAPPGLPLTLLGVLMIWGFFGGWNFTLFNVLVTRMVPREVRGTFLGIYNSLGFVGASVGPILFGYVADVAGFTSFFNLSLALFLSATVLAVLLREE